jgi:uncharacterized protein (DUF1684 family)
MSQLSYHDKIQELREKRDQQMTADPLNWLSLVGLFWLEEGENPFGKDEQAKIRLSDFPVGQCGAFRLENGLVRLTAVQGCAVRVNGGSPEARSLRADQDGDPDLISVGAVTMMLLKRGEHFLIRVWNTEALPAKMFTGLNYYPINPVYQLTAEFLPYDPPKVTKIVDVIGSEYKSTFAGRVRFTWQGVECDLDAQDVGEELLINFTDQTKTDATYPGGRYLVIPKPEGAQVTLDFNQAANWPCAYTSYATCPMPSLSNSLPVRIEDGEKRYH